ncbi:hypothetical protein [Bosea sp. (in: a-proteobacteria)]|uniref:hypothetical protein n=1 Tax=Bosea sp. (in: a-proteobacteria) TaxID=1871050 RepID=UPI002FCA2630
MTRRTILAMGMAGAIGLALAPQAHAAGFFDDLARVFGTRPVPPAAIGYPMEMMEMTVKPKRQKPRAAAAAAKPAVKLDPASDAYWYLRDPTLRKGDIVVTRSGVVVFDGRASSEHVASDFTALGETRRVSKAQQQAIQAGAAGGRAFFASNPPAATLAAVREVEAEASAAPAQ